ncbi:glycoside hydrolase family 44 protein [soil metagenome]
MAGCSAAADVSAPGADAGDDVVTDASADGETERDAGGGIDGAAEADAREAAAPPIVDPDTFLAGDVDFVTVIRTDVDRRPISPLIYGINGSASDHQPADVMKGVTLVRRGGDRGNSYNWETNVSNGSLNNGFTSDMQLATGIPDPNAPAGQDLAALAKNRAAGRATMVPFVLNDFVSGPVAGNIPWDQAGFDRALYFVKVELVKPTPFAATPDLGDGVVYTDEHLAYMKSKVAGDVTAPGPGRLIVGIDNEPDLYHLNFPMLQAGAGDPILAPNGRQVGTRVTGSEFTQRFIRFTKRVRSIAPSALIVGPSHYHFDGFTTWHLVTSPVWNDNGRWYMDDFLADVKAASAVAGTRLLDTWDFHWYPQPLFNGTYAWNLDDAARTMSPAEIDAVLQGPRSYWDPTYDEGSWITSAAHLAAPANILTRVRSHLDAGYPGTKLGVSEYFPGGRNHVSSGLATVDTLGVFQRMGVDLAAMWPVGDAASLAYAFGGLQLLRNADGNGLRYADTTVRVEHPEIVESSVYAGSDTSQRVTVLVVNKTGASRTFGLRLFGAAALSRVDVYCIDAAHKSPYLSQTVPLAKLNAYAYAAPPMSASMLVFRTP